jgi:hypothetical protein
LQKGTAHRPSDRPCSMRKNPAAPRRGQVRESGTRSQTRRRRDHATIRQYLGHEIRCAGQHEGIRRGRQELWMGVRVI